MEKIATTLVTQYIILVFVNNLKLYLLKTTKLFLGVFRTGTFTKWRSTVRLFKIIKTWDLLPASILDVDLASVVKDEVHVLVESDNASLHPRVHVLVKPDWNKGSTLEISEDEVDGLHHDLLDFGNAGISHVLAVVEDFNIRKDENVLD